MAKYTKPHITKEEIEEILGRVTPIKVSDDKLYLYQRAFVHCSVPNDVRGIDQVPDYLLESNERLEYLGDAYLACVVSKYLYTKYDKAMEGDLTKYCSRIVRGTQCSKFAQLLGMRGRVLMSDRTENMKGMDNLRFLEDAFEALIGALALDHGYPVVEEFIVVLIKKYLDEEHILQDSNYKDALLRYTQKRGMPPPEYIKVGETGRPNEKEFTVAVNLFGKRRGKGRGSKIKEAQQRAAKSAIESLNLDMPNLSV